MLFSTLLIVGSFLGAFAHTPGINPRSPTFLHKTTRSANADLHTRDTKNHRQQARFLNLPIFGTRVTTSAQSQSNSQFSSGQKTTRANFYIRKHIYSYFKECHEGVVGHVQRVTEICSSQITQENASSIAWELLAELQAILAICVVCVRKVKSCGNLSSPSGIPQTTDDCSMQDIAQLMYHVMCQIKICFSQMNTVCSQYEIIRTTCSDCLVQISTSASECMSASSSHLDGLLSIVTNLFGGNVESFFNLRVFGLNSIFQVFNSI